MSYQLSVGSWELARRTVKEALADNALGLAAQLAYYFTLALFPALLFLLAIASFFSVTQLTEAFVARFGAVLPPAALQLIEDQLARIANREEGGLLTVGFVGAFWTTSTALVAIIDAMNRAYGVNEGRAWWHARLLAIGLTILFAAFLLGASAIVLSGGAVLEWFGVAALTPVWAWLQWPLAFGLVVTGLMMVYRLAPDVEQQWSWCWPGALLAATLWLVASLGFRIYVVHFADYTATYGAVGAIIILLVWFYFLGLSLILGAELNSEIENASSRRDSKQAGERAPGQPDPTTPEGARTASAVSGQAAWRQEG
jgi:membrane protein